MAVSVQWLGAVQDGARHGPPETAGLETAQNRARQPEQQRVEHDQEQAQSNDGDGQRQQHQHRLDQPVEQAQYPGGDQRRTASGHGADLGRAPCRENVWRNSWISVVAERLNKKEKTKTKSKQE